LNKASISVKAHKFVSGNLKTRSILICKENLQLSVICNRTLL